MIYLPANKSFKMGVFLDHHDLLVRALFDRSWEGVEVQQGLPCLIVDSATLSRRVAGAVSLATAFSAGPSLYC